MDNLLGKVISNFKQKEMQDITKKILTVTKLLRQGEKGPFPTILVFVLFGHKFYQGRKYSG